MNYLNIDPSYLYKLYKTRFLEITHIEGIYYRSKHQGGLSAIASFHHFINNGYPPQTYQITKLVRLISSYNKFNSIIKNYIERGEPSRKEVWCYLKELGVPRDMAIYYLHFIRQQIYAKSNIQSEL